MRTLVSLVAIGLPHFCSASPSFDGVVRQDKDGRLNAYLPPPFASNHASFIEHSGNGSFTMGWFSGTHEGQSDVAIVLSHLDISRVGAVWSNATTVSQRSGYSNQNPVLHYVETIYPTNASSVLHIFHSQQPANKGEANASVWHLACPIPASAEPDFNHCSPAHEIFGKPGSFTKNRLVIGLDGSWVLPIYYAGAKPNFPFIKTLAPQQDPDTARWGDVAYAGNCGELVQPSVVRWPNATGPNMISFFRDRKARNIYAATSSDDAKTWSSCEPTVLPNNNAGIHATTLASGNIAMVYNPQTNTRDPLAISLSEDGGKTWKYTRILEAEDGKQEFSYPTMLQSPDGKIHISYTFKRQAIKYSVVDEDWIKETSPHPRVN